MKRTIELAATTAFLLSLLLTANVVNAAHPYHVSLTEIEWNSERETFEVAMWVWPADLEKGLAKRLRRPVDLDKEKQLDQKLAAYLETQFGVTTKDGKKLSIRWVGHEKNLKQAWLYFEVEKVTADTELTLENRIFFDLNDEQLNQVNAKLGKQEQRLTLTQSAAQQTVRIAK